MTSLTFFFFFIPLLAGILLAVNFLFASHNPYQEKDSVFECGFHSFLGQNRTEFTISFFVFALLFLLFDLEILLVYPYIVSNYNNGIFGLVIMLIFMSVLTLGFVFEIGKNALSIESRQKKHFNCKGFFTGNIMKGRVSNIYSAQQCFHKIFKPALAKVIASFALASLIFLSLKMPLKFLTYKLNIPALFCVFCGAISVINAAVFTFLSAKQLSRARIVFLVLYGIIVAILVYKLNLYALQPLAEYFTMLISMSTGFILTLIPEQFNLLNIYEVRALFKLPCKNIIRGLLNIKLTGSATIIQGHGGGMHMEQGGNGNSPPRSGGSSGKRK
ncbi:MAG: NADH-quinone oxidoreductase subunit A [Rickettsiales bacterium]|nr:MAG: NADH-quinone oxidoreductase subunit A [Rickettsiales bacterium]